ncbi:MAG TPA: histidine kinase [Rubrivivax sp.]|nr:histidine kinase [Rubrivivax sp.]
MILVGVQEEVLAGRGAFGWRLFDEAVSMSAATVVAAWRWRRGPSEDHLLARPARWFWHVVRWAPLVSLAFVAAVYSLRHAARALADLHYGHPPWAAVLPYETLKFCVFYLLFAGVQFGLRSHGALATAREHAERTQRLLREAQLAQLTQQMQPHFLFNALNTIAALVHDDPSGADTALLRLSVLLRSATEARPLQPLADELALARSYGGLMQQRFGERVRLHWHEQQAPALQKQAVPTLSLQPLLENCFVHGVERHLGPAQIDVTVQQDGHLLQITVESNVGTLRPDWQPGVGIGNLRQRLHTLYGGAASLRLLAVSTGPGVRALLTLPL